MPAQAKPKEKTLVMKYGGTSVGTPKAMSGAVEIVRQARAEWPRVVVVTSALSTVTNLLLDSAAQAVQGSLMGLPTAASRLRSLHYAIADQLIADAAARTATVLDIDALIAEFESLCRAIAILGEATPRALDAVAALGERMSVRLLAAAIESAGIPACYVETMQCVVTDGRFQNAHPDFQATTLKTRALLEPLLAQGKVPVATGFLGATPEGITTTLGRGGSDYSAAILGAVLPADDVWIWTDVDGVMTTDPRIVAKARTIAELTYREIAELAYYGAKVLHPKTIRPVVEAGIGLRICNTFNPSHPGTRLIADPPAEAHKGKNGHEVVKAVTAIRGQRMITVEGRGMLGVPGVAARTFGAVASTGTSVPLITQASSEQSICFAVPSESAPKVVAALEKSFASEIADKDIDRIWASDDVAIITAVGSGMIHTPGVAGRVFGALGKRGVNVIAIAQGSSEVGISLVVGTQETESAVQAIHDLILGEV
jgi:aspartate kinase